MTAYNPTEDKHCEHCGRPFHTGRSDRRFCNDTCRNAFNRDKARAEKQAANAAIPEIFKIITRNYAILQSFGALQEGEHYLIKQSLSKTGINLKFFTSTQQEGDSTWYFCFERGWHILSEDQFELKDDKSQLDLI